jgi:phosphoribosylamine--glycine ligase
MNILLIGSGGREHALAWKIAQSPLVTRLVAAPGNPGIAQHAERVAIAVTDIAGLVALAVEISADLVVVGPEAPLSEGLADALNSRGIPCFGPSQAAARLESSKAFTKDFCARHDLPTAAYGVFETPRDAIAFLDTRTAPYVIKADGLAAGKGVVIAQDREEAIAAINDMLGGKFGTAGARVVIEDFMQGEEVSLFALCDGKTGLVFGAAQDHKRVFDGDQGPNTGGMGAYTPAPVLSDELRAQAVREIIEPTLAGMASEGYPFVGVLYAGLMITASGPRLVEFNARFGDPECQALMLHLDGDLVPYLMAGAVGALEQQPAPQWKSGTSLAVVMAAKGYPEAPEAGLPLASVPNCGTGPVIVLHAGTRTTQDGDLVSAGGRVLTVCARAETIQAARDLAYAQIDQIDAPGCFWRRDIGWRAL